MSLRPTDRLVDEIGIREASQRRRVAGILFTYRCSIRCRHCLFGCAADRPDVAMTPRQCADALALLHETGRIVHIAGGEAMLYWDRLAEAAQLAHAEGNAPHFIETNCSFAVNDAVVRERLSFLKTHGLRGVLASADPFHQEHVPAARFLRVRRIAIELFGPQNFYGSSKPDAEIEALAHVTRDEERLRAYVRSAGLAMVGTAQRELARHRDPLPADHHAMPTFEWRRAGAGPGCAGQFRADTLWELHIDPYGNIQTNCGIILGNTARTTPARLLAQGPERANRFVELLCERGPLALAELARRNHGFTLPATVTQTCELCYLTRKHLRQFHPDIFGPAEVYA